MNEGNITFDAKYPNPPKGSRLRLTMAAEPNTRIVTAWVAGPGRNETVQLRQDFAVVRRDGTNASFINTMEPISSAPMVQSVEVTEKAADGSLAVKVTTREGTDWFLVGSRDFKGLLGIRRVGPFNTDAKLALVRVKKGDVTRVMFSGGSSLDFTNAGVASHYANNSSNPFHYVTFSEVNTAPRLAAISDQTIDEGQKLTFSATATDGDTPSQLLTFSLGAGFPAGASISAAGVFSWAPTESHGPWVYPITVIVTDNGTPPLSATRTFTITVRDAKPPTKSYAAMVKADGPVAYWRLGELSGRTAKDEMGGNHGAYLNGVTLGVPGAMPTDGDTAARFRRVPGQRVEVPWSAVINPPRFTAEVWARVTGGEGNHRFPLMSRTEDLLMRGYNFYAMPDNTWQVWWLPESIQGPRVEVNNWTHLVATCDGTTKRFYVNGVEVGSSMTPFTANDERVFYIGDGFEGDLDEVAIYNQALTREQVVLHYLAGTAASTPPVMVSIQDKTIDAGRLLDFIVEAKDAESFVQKLTFSLAPGAPSGTSIDPRTGRLTWTPDLSQGGKTHSITIRVTDDGNPPLSAETTFRVTVVIKPNTPPTLSVISDVISNEGLAVSLTVSATDADVPAQNFTFSLDADAPIGAAINATNGVFTWIPTEAQGPGTYPIKVRVTDDGSPPLSATNTFTVTVNEVSSAPVLAGISNQAVEEGRELVITALTTDADLPPNTLTYALAPGAPSGMAIDSVTGAIKWTPTEAQGPGNYPITVNVTDNGLPPLGDLKSFTVGVNEVNTTPVLTSVPDFKVDEGATLSFTALATDADVPANAVAFSLGAGAPAGAAIDPTTGAFTWTPTEAQGPSTNVIVLLITDNGTPPLIDTKTFTVVVNELNQAPVLALIPDKTVIAGSPLTFSVTATDADLPANTVNFVLDPNAPSGAAIDAASGLFAWTPTLAQEGTTNQITVRVSDNGSPALTDSKSFAVTVDVAAAVPAQLNAALLPNGDVFLIWTTTLGRRYVLERSADLIVWQELVALNATGNELEHIDATTPGSPMRFYRVVQR